MGPAHTRGRLTRRHWRQKSFLPLRSLLVSARSHQTVFGRRASRQYDEVAYIQLRWRTQTNGDIGQGRLLSRNPDNPLARCFVSSMLSIVRRFSQLCGPEGATTPPAVFQQSRWLGSTDHFDRDCGDTSVRSPPRLCARPESKRSELQQWSSHSYRVGACVIPHAM